MSWIVIVEGQRLKHSFDTEAEANQAAADARGTDWSKKIEVIDESAPKSADPVKPQAPVLGASVPLVDAIANEQSKKSSK